MTAPLVLLHGALASGAQLVGLAQRLGDRDVRTPDLAGHGHRPDAPHTLEAFVDTALAAGDGGPADLVGYSLGGYVALAAALAHPARVRRVVTIATKLAWTPEVAAAEVARLDPDAIAAKVPAFAASLERSHPGPGWRAVLASTAELLTSLGTAPPLDLRNVTCPVLVVVGERDALVTRAECEEAVAALPHGTLHVLPETPHPFERMDLDAVEAAVRRGLG